MTIDTSTPVVILANPHHCGLGILRGLGRLGVALYSVDSSRWTPSFFSRYCRGRFRWDLDRADPADSLDYLEGIASCLGRRPILIPTTDRGALFVADHAARLGESFIFPNRSRALVRTLCRKRSMCALAEKLHIPTPRTLFPRSRAELTAFAETVQFPVIVKGEGQFRKRDSKTKVMAHSRKELLDLCLQIGAAKLQNLIVQEYIPGGATGDWMFNGYFDASSECVAGFTGRKLRQIPHETGITSLGICQRNDALVQMAISFLRGVGYRGIVDMDFRYDARDGLYKVLDVNPRIGSTFRLFVSEDGMDVARALYLDMTGQPVPLSRTPEGRKWMVEDFDIAASFFFPHGKKLNPIEWLKSLRGVREGAFLAADDPLPVLGMLRADVLELWRHWRTQHDPTEPFEYDDSPEATDAHMSQVGR